MIRMRFPPFTAVVVVAAAAACLLFCLRQAEPEGVRDMQPLRDREAQVFHGQLQHLG